MQLAWLEANHTPSIQLSSMTLCASHAAAGGSYSSQGQKRHKHQTGCDSTPSHRSASLTSSPACDLKPCPLSFPLIALGCCFRHGFKCYSKQAQTPHSTPADKVHANKKINKYGEHAPKTHMAGFSSTHIDSCACIPDAYGVLPGATRALQANPTGALCSSTHTAHCMH
jgi:hypothetical protein